MANEEEEIILNPTNGRPMSFIGRPVWHTASTPERASSRYSGALGRWREVIVYQTASGTLVVYDCHRTQWQGENDTAQVHLFTSHEQVYEYLRGNPSLLAHNAVGEYALAFLPPKRID